MTSAVTGPAGARHRRARHLIVNPGAVGHSRWIGHPQAAYLSLEAGAGRLIRRLVDYDLEEFVRSVSERGMPEIVQQQLWGASYWALPQHTVSAGGWPLGPANVGTDYRKAFPNRVGP